MYQKTNINSLDCAYSFPCGLSNEPYMKGFIFSIMKCPICGNEFMPKAHNHKYCSRYCKVVAATAKRSKKPKTKICAVCKKEFKPYTSLDKYCSYYCRQENMKSKRATRWSDKSVKKRMGKNNPAYRNGDRIMGKQTYGHGQRLFTRNAKEIESVMIEDRGYKYCQYCGISNPIKFERHHIIFRSEKPKHKNLHDKENILIVCIGCHNKLHVHKGLRNKIVKERHLGKMFGADILYK